MSTTAQLVSHLFAETTNFIEEQVLPPLDWPRFNDLLVAHRHRRVKAHTAYVDVFPALASRAITDCAVHAIPVTVAWSLYLLAGRIFDSLQDSKSAEEVETIPTGLFAIGAAHTALSHIRPTSLQAEITNAFSQLLALTARGQGERPFAAPDSVEDYFSSVAARTGLVFATGAWAGGRISLSNSDDPQLDALYQYGLALGMMEQLIDDCTDLADDLKCGLYTLPVIYARSQVEHPNHQFLEQLLQEPQKTAVWVEQVITLLNQMGAVDWSLKVAEAYQARAYSALEGLDPVSAGPLREYTSRSYEIST